MKKPFLATLIAAVVALGVLFVVIRTSLVSQHSPPSATERPAGE